MSDESSNKLNSLSRSSQSSRGSISQKSQDSYHSNRSQASDESDSEEISIIPIHETEITISKNMKNLKNLKGLKDLKDLNEMENLKNKNISMNNPISKEASPLKENSHSGLSGYTGNVGNSENPGNLSQESFNHDLNENSFRNRKSKINEKRLEIGFQPSQYPQSLQAKAKYPQLSRKVKDYNKSKQNQIRLGLNLKSRSEQIIKGIRIINNFLNFVKNLKIHRAFQKLKLKLIKPEKLDFIPRFLSLRSYQMKTSNQPSNVYYFQNNSRGILGNSISGNSISKRERKNKKLDLKESIIDKVKNLLLSSKNRRKNKTKTKSITTHYYNYRNSLMNKATTFYYFDKRYPSKASSKPEVNYFKDGSPRLENLENFKDFEDFEKNENNNEINNEDSINKNFKDSKIKMNLNQINKNFKYNSTNINENEIENENENDNDEKIQCKYQRIIEDENKSSNSTIITDAFQNPNAIETVPYIKVKSFKTLESHTLKINNNRIEENINFNENIIPKKSEVNDLSFTRKSKDKSLEVRKTFKIAYNIFMHNNKSQSPIRSNYKTFKELKKIYQPLLEKMTRKKYSEKEFIWESRKFYEKLGPNDKKILLDL